MIIKIYADWKEIKNVCRETVNKERTLGNPGKDFKEKILIAEHSPIREIIVKWRWVLKSWIATHYSRHKWECYISSQRDDRTHIDRDNQPQGTLVIMNCSANAQSLIDTARKRLCHQSHPETRMYMEELKKDLYAYEPELANVLVPNGIYRAGCSEISQCGLCNRVLEGLNAEDRLNIHKRYDAYNKYFWGKGRNE